MSDTVTYRGTSDLYDVRSWKEADLTYDVAIGGVVSCSCPAFKYRKGIDAEGRCKHIREVYGARAAGYVGLHADVTDGSEQVERGLDLVKLLASSFDSGLALGLKVGKATR